METTTKERDAMTGAERMQEVEGGTAYGEVSPVTGHRVPQRDQQVTWRDPHTGEYDSAAFEMETRDGRWRVTRGRRPGWSREQSGRTYTFHVDPSWAREPQRRGGYRP